MNAKIKNSMLAGMKYSGVFVYARYRSRSLLRILAYHGVEHIEGILNCDGFQVDPETFSRQLDHIATSYRVVSLSEAIAGTEKPFWPKNSLLITFDDGYLNNLEVAAPILRQKGLPAVFFITTGFIDQTIPPWWYVLRGWIAGVGAKALGLPPLSIHLSSMSDATRLWEWETYLKSLTQQERSMKLMEISRSLGLSITSEIKMMNWNQVRELRDNGFDIGPHTVSHINLGAEDSGDIVREISTSMEKLERELGFCPSTYSYPYGRVSDIQPDVLSTLRSRNIRLGLTTVSGMNKPGSNSLLYKRLNITGNHKGLAFEKMLAMG